MVPGVGHCPLLTRVAAVVQIQRTKQDPLAQVVFVAPPMGWITVHAYLIGKTIAWQPDASFALMVRS